MGYVFILGTVLFTAYAQLMLKWRLSLAGPLPETAWAKLLALLGLVFEPFIFSGFVAGFAASLCWMTALSRLDLSHAYPFMALSFVLVGLGSVAIFHEPLTWPKACGLGLIVAGILLNSQG